MTAPTKRVIATHLKGKGATTKQADTWASFLHGLDWAVIKPIAQIAINSHVHPALAAGMVARTTSDEDIRATLQAHLESKAGALNEGTTSAGSTEAGTTTG
jgi:hypothetical protein